MDQMLNGPAVFKKQRPTMKRMGTQHIIAHKDQQQQFHPGQEEAGITNTSIPAVAVELTPKQRMEERKRQEADARAAVMTTEARGAINNYAQARMTRQQNTYNHMMSNPHAAA